MSLRKSALWLSRMTGKQREKSYFGQRMLSKICSHMSCFSKEPAETKCTLQGADSLSRHPALDMVGGEKHPGPRGDSALACCYPTFCLSWGMRKHPATQPRSQQTFTLGAAHHSLIRDQHPPLSTPLPPAAPHTAEAGGTHLQASHNSPAAGRGQSWWVPEQYNILTKTRLPSPILPTQM